MEESIKYGRPKKIERDRKSKRLNVRLTESELELLKNRLKESGYNNISAFLLDTLRGGKIARKPLVSDLSLYNDLSSVVRDVHAIGNNINQISKKINSFRTDIEDKILGYELNKALQYVVEINRDTNEIVRLIREIESKK